MQIIDELLEIFKNNFKQLTIKTLEDMAKRISFEEILQQKNNARPKNVSEFQKGFDTELDSILEKRTPNGVIFSLNENYDISLNAKGNANFRYKREAMFTLTRKLFDNGGTLTKPVYRYSIHRNTSVTDLAYYDSIDSTAIGVEDIRNVADELLNYFAELGAKLKAANGAEVYVNMLEMFAQMLIEIKIS